MKTASQIRQHSGLPWEQRKQSIISIARRIEGTEENPTQSWIAEAIASFGCLIAGSGQWDAAINLDEVRLAWWETRFPDYVDQFDAFFSKPAIDRCRSFVHPPTGRLLKTFLLTDEELSERLSFPELALEYKKLTSR